MIGRHLELAARLAETLGKIAGEKPYGEEEKRVQKDREVHGLRWKGRLAFQGTPVVAKK